ncbi:glycoside hydrolase family 10 protein [Parathielavia appendiculata]|uniref:Beta-xylanase n=1 Tax=Parathielavia appendiculata TaxID=2587402 RepID=A0AAN6TU52_9PEZI|nr:glycoside hydrolase family 10 protein [Parathielavia appendiculata]
MVSRLLASDGTVTAATVTTTTQNATQEEDGLNSLMVKAGKLYFGTATDVNNFADVEYQAIVSNKNMFGMITAENSMKWAAIQANEGKYSFADAEQVVAKAKANGQQIRCHTLIYTQLPPFVEEASWTNETLIATMQTYIKNVVQHFKGECYAWDVVIEAFGDSDASYRDSIFYRYIGPAFIPIAFSAAAAADPDAKLYYSDFNLEVLPNKAAAVIDLVKDLQARRIKIDGVGFQGHLVVGATPSRISLAASLKQFTDLGVEVAFTGVDIRHNSLPASDTALNQQAKDYAALAGSCLDVPKCVGVTLWQFTDKYSWVPNSMKGKGDALLWTSDYKTKPAYDAVMALLRAASNTTITNGTVTGDGKSAAGRVSLNTMGRFLGAVLSVWLLL